MPGRGLKVAKRCSPTNIVEDTVSSRVSVSLYAFRQYLHRGIDKYLQRSIINASQRARVDFLERLLNSFSISVQ